MEISNDHTTLVCETIEPFSQGVREKLETFLENFYIQGEGPLDVEFYPGKETNQDLKSFFHITPLDSKKIYEIQTSSNDVRFIRCTHRYQIFEFNGDKYHVDYWNLPKNQ